jgi:streptogramin lyase
VNLLRRLGALCLPFVFISATHATSITSGPPPPPPSSYSCIWYADETATHQVRTDTNQIVVSPALPEVHALAMNAVDCGVWALDEKTLYQFDSLGNPLQQIAIASLDPTLDDAHLLALDPYDKSLWLANEKRLVHVSAQGQVLAAWNAAGPVKRLALGLDETVWVLGNLRVRHYSISGTLLATYQLSEVLEEAPKQFVVDSLNGRIWLAGENRLVQLNINATTQAPLMLKQQQDITALTLNPQTGVVWIATKGALSSFDLNANPLSSVDLTALNISKVRRLAFDPDTQSLWAASESNLSRFTTNGAFVVSIPSSDEVNALAAPAFMITPTLSLLQPPSNALTNNPIPTFTVGYDALCNNQACGFAPNYFGSYLLTATLNNQAVGNLFTFNAGQANYTPTTRLPEGQNVFNAQATDSFGHLSNAVGSVFTVDTIPPKFLTITPADNAVLSNPNITIQGSVDDASASVVIANLQNWGGVGANPATQNFKWALTLKPGLNIFNLSAVDRAGNVSNYVLHLTYTPPAVTVTITSPGQGASLASDNITVSGTFNGPPNTGITVNGQVAGTSGNQYFVTLPLVLGSNTITVIVTGPDGTSGTQSLTVTSTGPAPISVTANPTRGLAPLKVSFTVNNRTGNGIARIDADFDGNGTIDFTTTNPNAPIEMTYGTPGVYQAKITVTDTQGHVYLATQVVYVQGVAGIAGTLRATYNGMLTNLRAGNIDAALTAVTASVYEKYRGVFTSLQSNLPSVVDQLGTLQNVTIGSDMAEAVLVRNTSNGPQVFLIYFLLGEDGVWRIDGM